MFTLSAPKPSFGEEAELFSDSVGRYHGPDQSNIRDLQSFRQQKELGFCSAPIPRATGILLPGYLQELSPSPFEGIDLTPGTSSSPQSTPSGINSSLYWEKPELHMWWQHPSCGGGERSEHASS